MEKRFILITILLVIVFVFSGCNSMNSIEGQTNEGMVKSLIIPEGTTIQERFALPQGFERVETEPGSFAYYLQNLPLKEHGSKVHYYDGRVKMRDVHEAVIDIDVGDRDLQQCADAIIRLRAEYLYEQGRFDDIAFHFTNGFLADYKRWRQGKRISVERNDVSWRGGGEPSESYESFRNYLNMVFAYAGTLSLSQELLPRSIEEMEIGDVFIQGGSPGHAVIVVDMAVNTETDEKIFMIAQSYMPAQDIHILKNSQNPSMSPWYSTDFNAQLLTPEWTFEAGDLKHFQ